MDDLGLRGVSFPWICNPFSCHSPFGQFITSSDMGWRYQKEGMVAKEAALGDTQDLAEELLYAEADADLGDDTAKIVRVA
jgi:hypothetical protein